MYPLGKIFGLALADLTTGDFITTELEDETALLTELQRLRPAEIIYPGEVDALRELLVSGTELLNQCGSWSFFSCFKSARQEYGVSPAPACAGFWLDSRWL